MSQWPRQRDAPADAHGEPIPQYYYHRHVSEHQETISRWENSLDSYGPTQSWTNLADEGRAHPNDYAQDSWQSQIHQSNQFAAAYNTYDARIGVPTPVVPVQPHGQLHLVNFNAPLHDSYNAHNVSLQQSTKSAAVLRNDHSAEQGSSGAQPGLSRQSQSRSVHYTFRQTSTSATARISRRLLAQTLPRGQSYAEHLYECLYSAPDHTLSLREIYDWMAQHSQKVRDHHSKGWKNSIRHNLSMNAAFERVETNTEGSSSQSGIWRLSGEALRNGSVLSTTRYRKGKDRKRRSQPSPVAAPAARFPAAAHNETYEGVGGQRVLHQPGPILGPFYRPQQVDATSAWIIQPSHPVPQHLSSAARPDASQPNPFNEAPSYPMRYHMDEDVKLPQSLHDPPHTAMAQNGNMDLVPFSKSREVPTVLQHNANGLFEQYMHEMNRLEASDPAGFSDMAAYPPQQYDCDGMIDDDLARYFSQPDGNGSIDFGL